MNSRQGNDALVQNRNKSRISARMRTILVIDAVLDQIKVFIRNFHIEYFKFDVTMITIINRITSNMTS